jgi:hypothetical protein
MSNQLTNNLTDTGLASRWDGLGVSRQGAMDLLHPLMEAGWVDRIGSRKLGWYVMKNT